MAKLVGRDLREKIRQAHPFDIDSGFVEEVLILAADFAEFYWAREAYDVRGRLAREIENFAESSGIPRKDIKIAPIGHSLVMLFELLADDDSGPAIRALEFLFGDFDPPAMVLP